MISWLFARRLVNLGLPGDPVVSYAAVGILASGLAIAPDVRATIHSFLSQAEIVGGLALVVTAQAAGMSALLAAIQVLP